jgi:hypothetical protein
MATASVWWALAMATNRVWVKPAAAMRKTLSISARPSFWASPLT